VGVHVFVGEWGGNRLFGCVRKFVSACVRTYIIYIRNFTEGHERMVHSMHERVVHGVRVCVREGQCLS
jgi:hypothetical protein